MKTLELSRQRLPYVGLWLGSARRTLSHVLRTHLQSLFTSEHQFTIPKILYTNKVSLKLFLWIRPLFPRRTLQYRCCNCSGSDLHPIVVVKLNSHFCRPHVQGVHIGTSLLSCMHLYFHVPLMLTCGVQTGRLRADAGPHLLH